MSARPTPASDAAAQSPRRYRGLSPEERSAMRREQLLDAGLELFGTQGYATSSIRAISAAAGLNSRYFYESFSSREELLYEVYQRTVAEVAVAMMEATAREETVEGQARAGLEVSWRILTGDRRKARLILLEVVGVSDRIETARRENRHAFADMLVRNALSVAGEDVELRLDPVLTARSLMGAAMEVLGDWIHGYVEASTDEIVEHLTAIYTAVAESSVVQRDDAQA